MEPNEIRDELVKLSPPGAVTVTSFMGVCFSDWVYIATFIYILVQCICLILKTYKTCCKCFPTEEEDESKND